MFIICNFILIFVINIILNERIKINNRKFNSLQILDIKVAKGTNVHIINPDYIPIKNVYVNGKKSNINNNGNIQDLQFDINDVTLEWDEKYINYTKLFMKLDSIIEVDFSNFDSTGILSMSNMFTNCRQLRYINFNNFNTLSVYDMSSMFEGCNSLKSLDLSNFDTLNVINMENMFKNCFALTSLNLSNFKTPKLMKMDGIFI